MDLLTNVVPSPVVVRVVSPKVLKVQDDPENVTEEKEQNYPKHRVGLPELIPFSFFMLNKSICRLYILTAFTRNNFSFFVLSTTTYSTFQDKVRSAIRIHGMGFP